MKIVITYLFIVLALAVGLVYSVRNSGHYLRDSQEAQEINLLMQHLDEASLYSSRLVAAYRGLLLSNTRKTSAFHDLYLISNVGVGSTIAKLSRYQHAESSEPLKALQLAMRQLCDFSDSVVNSYDQQGPEYAALLVGTGRGQAYIQSINDYCRLIANREREHLKTIEESQIHTAISSSNTSVALSFASFIIVTITFLVLNQEFKKRKKAEHHLQTLNEELEGEVDHKTHQIREIFDRIGDAFVAYDRQWRVTYLNAKAAESVGDTPQHIIGKNLWKEYPEVVGTPFHKACLRAMDSQTFEHETNFYPHLNRWFEYHLYPSPDGLSVFFTDITDEKLLKEKQERVAEQLKAVFDHAYDAILLADDQSRFLHVNASACELLGYSYEEITQLTMEDVVKEGRLAREGREPAAKVWASLQQEGKLSGTVQVKHKAGHLLTCRINAKARILKGVHLSILSDITELMKSHQRYQTAEAIAKLGHWELNMDDHSLIWSDEIYRMFGFDPAHTKPHYDLFFERIHPDDREAFQVEQDAALSGTKPLDAIHRIIVNNQIRYVHEIGKPELDERGKVIKFSGLARDITEEKTREEALRESERRYRLIFENNPLPMWIFDKHSFQFLDVNQAALTHYGYQRNEFLKLTSLDIRPREDIERYKALDRTAPLHAAGVWRHCKKDGTIIHVDIKVHDITYDGREARLTLINDVSEQLKFEEDRMSYYDQLRELTARLQWVREEERTHIAREIHDDLGQHLTGLKMDAVWLQKKSAGNNPEVKEHIAGMIDLINSSVETVRRIAGRLRLNILEDFGLVAALEWQCTEFQKRTGITTSFVSDAESVVFERVLSINVYRILQEALTNVAKHANASSVKVNLSANASALSLHIEDDGIGFNPTETTRKGALGLVGMKERANMFGGNVLISAKKGIGTMVTLRIPL